MKSDQVKHPDIKDGNDGLEKTQITFSCLHNNIVQFLLHLFINIQFIFQFGFSSFEFRNTSTG